MAENGMPLQVLKRFRIIFGAVRQHFNEVEKVCGVSGSQLWIMNEIAKTPGLGVSELAGRLSIHQSTCSQLVDKLVAKGMVSKTRNEQDQRRVGLSLSPRGVEILPSAPGPAEGLLPSALSELPESTLLELDRNLQAVIEQMSEKDVDMADKPLSEM